MAAAKKTKQQERETKKAQKEALKEEARKTKAEKKKAGLTKSGKKKSKVFNIIGMCKNVLDILLVLDEGIFLIMYIFVDARNSSDPGGAPDPFYGGR